MLDQVVNHPNKFFDEIPVLQLSSSLAEIICSTTLPCFSVSKGNFCYFKAALCQSDMLCFASSDAADTQAPLA